MPMSLKSNSSLLLLMWESFRSHEASEGERGGAEANTLPFWEIPGLGWEAGLKAEVSPSGMPCTQDSWRGLVLSNIPLSTMSPPVASFSGEKGGKKAWLLFPKLAFSVSISWSNGSPGQEPRFALLLVEGMVNGAAVAFSSLFRISGLIGVRVGENRSWDRGEGTRPVSGKTSCFQGLWLVSMSANEDSRFTLTELPRSIITSSVI